MITFELFKKLMAFKTKNSLCIEIFFKVKGNEKFDCCWMGKLYDKNVSADVFWFGLTPDGKNGYDYTRFEDFLSAKVFDDKSLVEIWDDITISEINGCDPMVMVEMYLYGSGGLMSPQ